MRITPLFYNMFISTLESISKDLEEKNYFNVSKHTQIVITKFTKPNWSPFPGYPEIIRKLDLVIKIENLQQECLNLYKGTNLSIDKATGLLLELFTFAHLLNFIEINYANIDGVKYTFNNINLAATALTKLSCLSNNSLESKENLLNSANSLKEKQQQLSPYANSNLTQREATIYFKIMQLFTLYSKDELQKFAKIMFQVLRINLFKNKPLPNIWDTKIRSNILENGIQKLENFVQNAANQYKEMYCTQFENLKSNECNTP